MNKETWKKIIQIIIVLLTAIASSLAVQSCTA